MRIAATSDLHGHFPAITENVDVLLIAGDIVAGVTEKDEIIQWRNFGHWLVKLVDRGVTPIGIAGNHDFLLQNDPDFARSLPWVYLCDSGIEFGGLNFFGTPWQPWFQNWAFNAPEIDPGEEFLHSKFRKIPSNTDVLIAHGPPAGFHDRVGKRNVGSSALNTHIQRVCPKLVCYGHVHENYGVEHCEGVTLANVSHTVIRDGYYVAKNDQVVFEL